MMTPHKQMNILQLVIIVNCLYTVGMCPAQDEDDFLRGSTVEELRDPMPELFQVLTEEEDIYLRWLTFNYPAHLDLLYFKPHGQGDYGLSDHAVGDLGVRDLESSSEGESQIRLRLKCYFFFF